MTAAGRYQPDPTTQAALDALRSRVTTDKLLSGLERRLRADGATFDDIDQSIIAELGISASDWHGYHAVHRAADRYQHAHHPKIPDQGAPMG
ncbi:MAG: hypothetical protein GEU78_15475 [Actinobacteria bacterium]|nr:hypothetical protein [Actinomycetota bacterium]